MEKKSSGYQTGIASEHLVLSMLYRLGAKAYLTLGNEKSIDIRITKDDGSWISVDVKSVPSHIVVERRKEFNGGPIDIFKKDIIEYQNKWEILGTFVENGELSTEKK